MQSRGGAGAGATASRKDDEAMQSSKMGSWLGWTAIVLPSTATALTWPLTDALPFVNRVAIGVAVALVLYTLVHYASEASRWAAERRQTRNPRSKAT
jgi:hypothetical protein